MGKYAIITLQFNLLLEPYAECGLLHLQYHSTPTNRPLQGIRGRSFREFRFLCLAFITVLVVGRGCLCELRAMSPPGRPFLHGFISGKLEM